MHAANNSKSLVACEITACELINLIYHYLYPQLQLAQPSLTHLTELNYLQLALTNAPLHFKLCYN